MKNRLHFYLLGLSPLLLAFFVWDLEFSVNSPSTADSEPDFSIPDAIVENPTLRQYNLYGQLERLIQGTELLSFANENRLQVAQPSFVFTEPSGDLWNISALQGNFLEQQNIFQLEGEVEMLRESERLPLSLTTTSLELDLNGQIIQTLAPILIEAPGHQISGIGFRANLNTNQFEILNKVVARHDSI